MRMNKFKKKILLTEFVETQTQLDRRDTCPTDCAKNVMLCPGEMTKKILRREERH